MFSRRVFRVSVFVVLFAAVVSVASLALAQSGDTGEVGPFVKPVSGSDSLFQNVSLGQSFLNEQEPNDTAGQATPLGGSSVVAQGYIAPNGDLDYYSFTAGAGDTVFAATMTSFSASGSTNSIIDIIDTDGVTVLESDNDDGTFSTLSSTVAGTTLVSGGTYYVQVRNSSATLQIRPYRLYVQVRSGSPTAETEPNDTLPGQVLPPSGWVSGNTSATTDADIFAIPLNAGDTVYLSLDLDPERDTVEWNAQLGLGVFNGFFLVANDGGTAGTPDSEAFFMTVQSAGTYSILVNVPTGGTTFGTYELSVTVFPAEQQACTTYTSTDVPQTIPDGPGMVSSTLTVPGNPIIGDLDVSINLNHLSMPDLDVHLVSPEGNDNGLFSDIGATTQPPMNLTLDDEAGIPIGSYTVVSGMSYTPESAYRLHWFDGEDAGGTWTLVIRDDLALNGGTLNGWSITICEPPPMPVCPGGTEPIVVYSSDFEANDGGFTHSGTLDEWEWGLPTFNPLASCSSGTGCWATDLDNTYENSSDQDLLSPNINLAGFTDVAWVTWSRRFNLESANFDHAYFDVQQVGGASPRRVWEWRDGTMTDSLIGNPTVTVEASAGWGTFTEDISDYLGQNIELLFHLDTDTSVQKAGLAIDDITVTACEPGATPTPTNTPVVTNTPTVTTAPTNTSTATPVPTNTATNTPVPTNTSTASPVPTNTATNTPVPTDTATSPAPTDTATSPAPTATATQLPTNVDVSNFDGQNDGMGLLYLVLAIIGAIAAGVVVYGRRKNGREAK